MGRIHVAQTRQDDPVKKTILHLQSTRSGCFCRCRRLRRRDVVLELISKMADRAQRQDVGGRKSTAYAPVCEHWEVAGNAASGRQMHFLMRSMKRTRTEPVEASQLIPAVERLYPQRRSTRISHLSSASHLWRSNDQKTYQLRLHL